MRRGMAIEALLQWAYRESGAVEALRMLSRRPDGYRSALQVLSERAGSGGTSGRAMKAGVDEGLRVILSVRALPRLARELVELHAAAASRPDWLPGARPRFEPAVWLLCEVDEGGSLGQLMRVPQQVLAEAAELDRGLVVVARGGRKSRIVVPVRYVDRPQEIRRARRRWQLWRAVLVRLQAQLRLGLGLPPKAPWQG